MGRKLNEEKLEQFLQMACFRNNQDPESQTVKKVKVSNLARIGEGWNNDTYSFVLTFNDATNERQVPLILKAYSNKVYPDLAKKRQHGENVRKCRDEFEVLKSLWRLDFPVPQVFLEQCTPGLFGFPFTIMLKEEVKEEQGYELDSFAKTLAKLHNFKLSELKIRTLQPPRDNVSFAKRWPIHFDNLLNSTRPSKILRKDFDLAIRWLKSQASENSCPDYRLVHGDYSPTNIFINDSSKLTVIDWEFSEIGDPAYDVGYAYHFIRFLHGPKNLEGERKAEQFLAEYMSNFQGDIRPRLKFYQVVGILRLALFYNSVLSNPKRAYKMHGPKALLAFPIVRRPFIAQQVEMASELAWLEYSRDFLNSALK